MSSEVNYKNNPLHALGLKTMVEELVEHYGFEILEAYLQLNCFKINPSVTSAVKFLKKTEWAREKVEGFYMYQFKSLPRATAQEFSIAPRDRVIPDDQSIGEPAKLSLEDAARLQEKREKKAAEHDSGGFKGKPKGGPKKPSERSGPYGNNGGNSSGKSDSKPYPSKPKQHSSERSNADHSSPYGKSPTAKAKPVAAPQSSAPASTAPAQKPSSTATFDPWANAKNKLND